MFQNMSSKTPPGRSTQELPEIFPPTKRNKASERIEFPNGSKWGVSAWLEGDLISIAPNPVLSNGWWRSEERPRKSLMSQIHKIISFTSLEPLLFPGFAATESA